MSEDHVVVIDQTGRAHHFDADSWHVDGHNHLSVVKDGKDAEPVATFPARLHRRLQVRCPHRRAGREGRVT